MKVDNSVCDRAPVIAVIGATSTGKTSLGIELATRFDGEVVNADSRLFYRGMDIGTAKPQLSERRGVPHHLIDILEPQASYSLSDFLREAKKAIADIGLRGKTSVVVGGSGQYIWGLLEGWQVPKIPPNPTLREELENQLETEGIASLQERLRKTGAKRIDQVEALNPRRLIRAIERAIATGDAMGGATKSVTPPYDSLVIGLTASRDVLHSRVEDRIDQMLDANWLEEVKKLRCNGVKRDTPSMSAIGYRELFDYIDSRESWETVREAILVGNRRLIGAQNNWFKARDERISWFDITTDDFAGDVIRTVNQWLRNRGGSFAKR